MKPWTARPLWVEAAILLIVCSALAAAAAAAFPTMDDAYLSLLLRENGPPGVLQGHMDRPLVAHLLSMTARLFGGQFWTFAFIANAIIWSIFGIETCALWRLAMPAWKPYAIVAGLLAVSPIVVQVQLSTATVTLFGVLSVALAYGGLLALVSAIARSSRMRLGLGLVLVALAVLLTEYGVAAACAVAMLLAGGLPIPGPSRRRRSLQASIAVLAVAAIAYSGFLLTSDLRTRPEVDPRRSVDSLALVSFPFSAVSHLWQILVGAYGTAFGRFWVGRDSRSTIVALGCGLVFSLAVLLVLRAKQGRDDDPRDAGIRVLFASVLAGVFPVALMRPYAGDPFATRFNLPALPVAVVFSLACLLWALKPQFRVPAALLLAFVAGISSFSDSWNAIRQRREMKKAGDVILRQLPSEGLIAVVVASRKVCEVSEWCSGQAMLGWPLEAEKRVWLLDHDEGLRIFGSRVGHGPIPPLDEDVRSIRRVGPVQEVLWVEAVGDEFLVEPYFRRAPEVARD